MSTKQSPCSFLANKADSPVLIFNSKYIIRRLNQFPPSNILESCWIVLWPFMNMGCIFPKKLLRGSIHCQELENIWHRIPVYSCTSLVIPLFDYCDTVYGILPTADANPLQILQNKACQIILCRNRFAHSEDTHRDLSLPYLKDRRELHLACIMFKTVNNLTPKYLTDLLTPVSLHGHGTRGAEELLLELPLLRSQKGQYAFSFTGPSLWNRLPADIRSTKGDSKNAFRNAVIRWQKDRVWPTSQLFPSQGRFITCSGKGYRLNVWFFLIFLILFYFIFFSRKLTTYITQHFSWLIGI